MKVNIRPNKNDGICRTCESYVRCSASDKTRGMACSSYMRKEKKENTVKIVRFKDGDMLCVGGTKKEVEEKMKKEYPDKEIAVIA